MLIGPFGGAFSVGDLFILNLLTIITEFMGVGLAMTYFGVSQVISAPIAAVLLIAITVTGSFRRWERVMCLCVATSFLAVPLALLSHPKPGPVAGVDHHGGAGPRGRAAAERDGLPAAAL